MKHGMFLWLSSLIIVFWFGRFVLNVLIWRLAVVVALIGDEEEVDVGTAILVCMAGIIKRSRGLAACVCTRAVRVVRVNNLSFVWEESTPCGEGDW